MLRATARSRDSVEDLANPSIAAGGRLIAVDQVASFRPMLEYSGIRRENQVRQIVVSGKSAADTLAGIQPVLAGLDLPPGYRLHIGGELEDGADVQGRMGANMPIALGVMLAAPMFQFNSIRRSLATFPTVPLIAIGAPCAMIAAGQPMSLFALLGLMSLMGIIINDAIVLIDQIDIRCFSRWLSPGVAFRLPVFRGCAREWWLGPEARFRGARG